MPFGAFTQPVQTRSPNTRTVLNLPSAARATYSSGPLAVGDLLELMLDFNVTTITGGTTPTVQFQLSVIGGDGVLYPIATFPTTAIPAGGGQANEVQGVGSSSYVKAGQTFGNTIQIDMVVTGAPTSVTFSGSIIGK